MAGQAMLREPQLADFDFALPPGLIAQHPLPDRAASRLLHVTPSALVDRQFRDIESLVERGEVLVFNDTRVIRARRTSSGQSLTRVPARPQPLVIDWANSPA